jgi:hypothetical protein
MPGAKESYLSLLLLDRFAPEPCYLLSFPVLAMTDFLAFIVLNTAFYISSPTVISRRTAYHVSRRGA